MARATREKTASEKSSGPAVETKTEAKRPRRKTEGQSAMGQSYTVTEEERHRMIAEAAYLRAEQRGFQGGNPNEDWYAAAAEIDAMLAGEASPPLASTQRH